MRWLASNLPGASPDLRGELAAAVDRVSREQGVISRSIEACSLIGLSLTLLARLGTGDDRIESTRQGVRIGAMAAAIAVLVRSAAAGEALLVSILALLVVSLGGGLVLSARLLAVVAIVAGQGRAAGETVVVLLVVGAGVLFGRPHDQRRCPAGAVAAAGGAGVAVLLGVMLPSPLIEPAIITVALVAVVGLIAAGWFDPRYAVAAAVVCVSRLIETGGDLLGLGDVAWLSTQGLSTQGLSTQGLSPLRLASMLTGVGISLAVARYSLRWRIGPAASTR